jgi:hypothetical protein
VADPERFPDFLLACHLAVYQNHPITNLLFLEFFSSRLDDSQRQKMVDSHDVHLGRYSLFDTACRAYHQEAVIVFVPYVNFRSEGNYFDALHPKSKPQKCSPEYSVTQFMLGLFFQTKVEFERFLTRFLDSGGDRLGPVLGQILFAALEKKVDHRFIDQLLASFADINEGLFVKSRIQLSKSKEGLLYVNLTCVDLMNSLGDSRYEAYLEPYREQSYPFLNPYFFKWKYSREKAVKVPFWQAQFIGGFRSFPNLPEQLVPLNILFSHEGLPLGKPFETSASEFRFFIDYISSRRKELMYTEPYLSTSSGENLTIPRILLDNMQYESLLFIIRFRGLDPAFFMTPEYLKQSMSSRLFVECVCRPFQSPDVGDTSAIISFLTPLLCEYPHIFVNPLFFRFFNTVLEFYYGGVVTGAFKESHVQTLFKPLFQFFKAVVDILPKYEVSPQEIAHFYALLVLSSSPEREAARLYISQHYPLFPQE